MGSTPFSQELIELIIDQLHDHSESLSNCALVERSWTPATRFHIFSSINLYLGLLFYNPKKKAPRLEHLLALLESPHSTIAQFIREITLLFSLADPAYLSFLVHTSLTGPMTCCMLSFSSCPVVGDGSNEFKIHVDTLPWLWPASTYLAVSLSFVSMINRSNRHQSKQKAVRSTLVWK